MKANHKKNLSMTKDADVYFIDGCGRCKLGGTPQCKVNRWKEELAHIRAVVLQTELTEESKWGMPCYTSGKNNIVMIGAFNDYCSLSFFKGALLKDTKKLLVAPGENSQAVRMFKFTDPKQVIKNAAAIKSYIQEAIELEKAGKKVEFKKIDDQKLPVELENRLSKNTALKKAFYALTPGRQRGYILFFSAPKQAATREARIDKYTKDILAGRGIHD
jgi:uncharacterized protein YdeI (YjbR/CyaY-like superfamily)